MRASSILAASLLLLSSCGDDGGTTGANWQQLGSKRASSLLATWAGGLDDVWVVGGREGIGGTPAVHHYDGSTWTKLETGQVNLDLWQVFGFDDAVFVAGSKGTILRYANGAFTVIPTPAPDVIVFGLWGSSSSDVWAVGGQASGRAFVWRYQGTAFEAVAGVPDELTRPGDGGTVWKVTGRAANDIWMSCSKGLVLRWNGQALSSEQVGAADEALFSIGCNNASCVTAGTNVSNGVLYQNDGQSWSSRVPTPDGPVWRGVTPTGEHTYVVGMFGAIIRLDGDRWVSEPHGLTTESLHAAWSDGSGNVFAVGGKFDQAITADGVLLYKGATTLPALP